MVTRDEAETPPYSGRTRSTDGGTENSMLYCKAEGEHEDNQRQGAAEAIADAPWAAESHSGRKVVSESGAYSDDALRQPSSL